MTIDTDYPTRRHRWGEPVTVAENTHSNCQETHRRCVHCKMVKVTVHPPGRELPYRAWVTRAGMRVSIEATPPCLDEVAS